MRPVLTRRLALTALFLGVVLAAPLLAGCSAWPHALKPEQLWKLNRQPPASGDGLFSIPARPLPPHATDRSASASARDVAEGE